MTEIANYFGSVSTLSDLPAWAAKMYNDAPAVVTDDRTLSYADIDILSGQLANALAAKGVERGCRVVLFMPNCWQWVIAYYAITRAGGIVVPANSMLTGDELSFVIKDSGAQMLISSAQLSEKLEFDQLSGSVQVVLDDDRLFFPEDTPELNSVEDWSHANPNQIDGADIAVIGYTSGTTGRPKGAVLLHEAMTLNAQLTATSHGRSAKDKMISALPCAHIYGMLMLNTAIQAGATLRLFGKFDAEETLACIENWGATILDGVPTMYLYLLNSPSLKNRDVSSLRMCTVGGQAMPLSKMQEVRKTLNCRIVDVWGMTEIAGVGLTHPIHMPERLGSAGVTLPSFEVRIASLEDKTKEVPRCEPGELLIRGPTIMREYWNQDEQTRATISSDGWLSTGDIAYQDQDGFIYIKDRKKEMIITAGFNIYPSEIERVLAKHPAVALAAVAGQADDDKGEIAVAFVELKPFQDCTENDLLDLCRRDLSAYKVPRKVRFVDELPRTSSGKIKRQDLRSYG